MSGQLFDIAEIAALLLVAYVIGWVLGYVLHRVVAPLATSARTGTAQDDARVESAALEHSVVTASAPVAVSATTPVEIAATIPEPGRTSALPANAQPIAAPAVVSALETLRSLSTAMPLVPGAPADASETATRSEAAPMPIDGAQADARDEAAAPAMTESEISLPEPEPESAVAADSAQPSAATPATTPGVAWSGVLGGHAAEHFEPPADGARPVAEVPAPPEAARSEFGPPAASPNATTSAAERPDLEAIAEPALDVAMLDAIASELMPVSPDGPPEPAMPTNEGSADPGSAAVIMAETPPPAGNVAGNAESPSSLDEDSAMRDIEGGWSRRGGRSSTADLTDVSAAVNAAQFAVEQVLARSGISADATEDRGQTAFGKPRGLPRPRDGGRDDLKQIAGLGPMDESALNNLGIYHFDQIANLDDREVLWLENHAFARGRIGRENWQQQARELGAETASLRVGR